jgi:hypothetical protein
LFFLFVSIFSLIAGLKRIPLLEKLHRLSTSTKPRNFVDSGKMMHERITMRGCEISYYQASWVRVSKIAK